MVRIEPLPESLVQTPFTVYESRALGVPAKRLRAQDLSDGGRLIYLPAGGPLEIVERARVLTAATPGAWASHETAAVLTLLGLPRGWADVTASTSANRMNCRGSAGPGSPATACGASRAS